MMMARGLHFAGMLRILTLPVVFSQLDSVTTECLPVPGAKLVYTTRKLLPAPHLGTSSEVIRLQHTT